MLVAGPLVGEVCGLIVVGSPVRGDLAEARHCDNAVARCGRGRNRVYALCDRFVTAICVMPRFTAAPLFR